MVRGSTTVNGDVSVSGRLSRRVFVGASLLVLAFAGVGGSQKALAQEPSCTESAHWVGTWATSTMPAQATFGPATLSFENQTLRQIVHLSIGGSELRVRMSNEYGSTPLTIGAAHVALQEDTASIVPRSDRTLTFSRHPSVVIPPGQVVVSDPINLEIAEASDLAISIFVPNATGPVTWHETAQATTYISPPGDFTTARDMPTQSTAVSYYWISGVEVRAPQPAFSVVAFGDSITDGMNSTVGTNSRWPDFLSQRLNAKPGHRHGHVGVLNEGISGNRLLRDFVGPNAEGRFERDVLDQPGAKYVVMMIGINDIGLADAFGIPGQAATATDIITGLGQLVTRAHAQNLRIYGGTLTPDEGTYPGYFTPEHEAARQTVNQWIRTSGTYDAVIDFDAVLRDPARPTQLLPAYDSGDHLHPSDAGYQAMANAIDLRLFNR